MTTPIAHPPYDAIAHRELAVRIALDKADLDPLNLEVAAALLRIAIEAFRLDTKESLQALVGGLHDVVQGKAPPEPKRAPNTCCEHVARGVADVAGETELQFSAQDGGTVITLVRLCSACLVMDGSVKLTLAP